MGRDLEAGGAHRLGQARDGRAVPVLSGPNNYNAEDIADLLQASYEAHGDTIHVDPEVIRVETRHLVNVDPRQDMILGFVGDRLVARSLLTWADSPDEKARHYQSWGDIHPEWRRRGLGRAERIALPCRRPPGGPVRDKAP